MKANPRPRAIVSPSLASAVLCSALVAGCVPPPERAPAPAPAAAGPIARPAPAPPPVADWRDAPLSAGTWVYAPSAAGSAARFAGGLFTIGCDSRSRTVTLVRAGAPHGSPAAIAVTTSSGTRMFAAAGTPQGVAATVPGRDPGLDAMAFSRGRFAVAVTGEATLFVPSWAEVSRVIEDCR
ncbi:hypothetical protein [Novosphingobium soli]|uniref:Lipoprotein n=1 Tax=Novosphingobium soli TaxID=574956 RepID=A0ABV6CSI3_9SPHN